MSQPINTRTRAQESRSAIERLYVAMRHLFIRGAYKPLGVSGQAMVENLKILRPEIYGDIGDPERVELEGLLYVFQRLPKGIEECRYIRLISREGFENSDFEIIAPPKRRRNCYRIDAEQMFIEMTRGRSDIYDILTHLTFLYIEAEKIRRNSEDHKDKKRREWQQLEEIVLHKEATGEAFNCEVAFTYLSTLLGRTYEETAEAFRRFAADADVNSLFHITYWLGRLSTEEADDGNDREISFSSALRERVGHHHYGEQWADNIKQFLHEKGWLERPLHIISANPHSVMNALFAGAALQLSGYSLEDLARDLSQKENSDLRSKVRQYALQHGMYQFDDTSGTNITVQLFDTLQINSSALPPEIHCDEATLRAEQPIIFVMDYAFGEQAYETMDELLKPFEINGTEQLLNVASIAIMGKAGILEGGKGDIMVPTAHVFEGTADNYPLENDFTAADFKASGLAVFEGPMITVLGTSLQNKDILTYFLTSSWRAIGLEMEGAHYQKAIQSAAKIRRSIREDVKIRYAYYASDNPLITGHTLASGSLGLDGVKPTYFITLKMLNKILGGE
ncbi:MAG TPA: hypothetical protein PKC76_04685 [Saprospiraceae bacterium]|nr:hypothetical protein [Saprospiraceae bacterium]HMP23402.1 hypothetical protein [Saprospiraceae bacterium]